MRNQLTNPTPEDIRIRKAEHNAYMHAIHSTGSSWAAAKLIADKEYPLYDEYSEPLPETGGGLRGLLPMRRRYDGQWQEFRGGGTWIDVNWFTDDYVRKAFALIP